MPPNQKPSYTATTRNRSQILNWGKTGFRVALIPLRLLTKWFKGLFLRVISFPKKIQRRERDQIIALILLLIWIGIILGFYFRGNDIFEGNLIVQEMSFTYTGGKDKLFIDNLNNIKNLDIKGSQTQPLVLNGTFSIKSDPALNQKLSQRHQLTIELPYTASRLIFAPVNPTQNSEISILKLRIHPDSQVNQLAYNSQPPQLSFCLQSASALLEDCLLHGNFPNNPAQAKSATVGNLKLKLGQQPLIVSMEMFNLPELGIRTDIDDFKTLTLQFIPEIDENLLKISSPTQLFIDLPKLPKAKNITTVNSSQWLQEDIDVKAVRFYRFDIKDNTIDELKKSTILTGEVRMGKEVIKLQTNQFLVVSDKPGIRKLRDIQINTQSPPGLQTLISGESQSIKVGLYPEFPVQSIELSWLSKFPQEGVNSLLAFIAAITGVLLPRLLPEPNKNSEPAKNTPDSPQTTPNPAKDPNQN